MATYSNTPSVKQVAAGAYVLAADEYAIADYKLTSLVTAPAAGTSFPVQTVKLHLGPGQTINGSVVLPLFVQDGTTTIRDGTFSLIGGVVFKNGL